MKSRERVWRSLEFEEPDRVPIMEMGIDPPHIEALMGKRYEGGVVTATLTLEGQSREEELIELTVGCYEKLGFDIIEGSTSSPKGWRPKMNTDGTMTDEWGRILYYDKKCQKWSPGGKTIFSTIDEWENFSLPDPAAPGRSDSFEYMKHLVDGRMVLAGSVRDPFALLWEMFTPVNFVKWMYRNPLFIRRMFEKIVVHNISMINLLADCGAELIISNGDWCDKKGPMVPVKFFREIVFPGLMRQVHASHSQGLKFIKHTDGNIMPLLEDLAGTVDGMHSLDPSAGVDIEEVKTKYGDRLVLFGNVSVDNLARKSKREIVDETKGCIRRASPGGGHILTSSNTWFADAKLENCLTMVEVGRKFGTYPLRS